MRFHGASPLLKQLTVMHFFTTHHPTSGSDLSFYSSPLRKHVIDRSAGGVHETPKAEVGGRGLAQGITGTGGGGLGRMPDVKNLDV